MCNKFENHLEFFQVSLKETKLCKIWILFAFFSRFFQRNSTLWNMKVAYTFSKVLLKKLNLCKIWNCQKKKRLFQRHSIQFCVFVWDSQVFDFRFLVYCDWRKWDHWTFNITCRYFPLHIFTFIQALLKYGDGEWIRGIRWRWKIKKPSNMLCIFFSIVLLLFVGLVCIFLFLKLYQQAQDVLCDCNYFVLCFCCYHLDIFAICPPSQIIFICNSLSLFLPPYFFFAIVITESSTSNTLDIM